MADRRQLLWSPAEDDVLRAHWGRKSGCELAKYLRRPLKTVYRRAARLGLSTSPAWESLYRAALRTGYSIVGLQTVLRFSGVQWLERKRGRRVLVVERAEVDRAIAAWLATETLSGAARARNLDSGVLREWLVQAGVPIRRIGVGNGQWRIERSVIDAVVAERQRVRAEGSEAA